MTYKKRREREVVGDVRATEDPSFWSRSAERGDRVAREGIPRVAACRPNERRAGQRGSSKTSAPRCAPSSTPTHQRHLRCSPSDSLAAPPSDPTFRLMDSHICARGGAQHAGQSRGSSCSARRTEATFPRTQSSNPSAPPPSRSPSSFPAWAAPSDLPHRPSSCCSTQAGAATWSRELVARKRRPLP